MNFEVDVTKDLKNIHPYMVIVGTLTNAIDTLGRESKL